MPANNYFAVLNGEQQGPFDLNEIKEMVKIGEFSSGTFVWAEGMDNWTEAIQVAGLAALLIEAESQRIEALKTQFEYENKEREERVQKEREQEEREERERIEQEESAEQEAYTSSSSDLNIFKDVTDTYKDALKQTTDAYKEAFKGFGGMFGFGKKK